MTSQPEPADDRLSDEELRRRRSAEVAATRAYIRTHFAPHLSDEEFAAELRGAEKFWRALEAGIVPSRLDWSAVPDVILAHEVDPLAYLPAEPGDEERIASTLPPVPADVDATVVSMRLHVTLAQWKRLRPIAATKGFDQPSALLQSLLDEAVETVLGAGDQADQENPASDGGA